MKHTVGRILLSGLAPARSCWGRTVSADWSRAIGLGFGSGLWLAFLMLEGGMGVTRSIPALEGQGPPVLLGRTTVNAVANYAPNENDYQGIPWAGRGPAPSGTQDTLGEEPPVPNEVVGVVLEALQIDAVRESLNLPPAVPAPTPQAAATVTSDPDGLPGAVVRPGSRTPTPSGAATTTVTATASRSPSSVAGKSVTPPAAQPTPIPPAFSFADNLAPGRPAASVVNFVNGSKEKLDAYVRPVILSDTGLCPALRISIAVMAKGGKPVVLGTGDLVSAARSNGFPIALTPGVEYTSVVLFNLPSVVDNSYQGRTCTVDVLLTFGNTNL